MRPIYKMCPAKGKTICDFCELNHLRNVAAGGDYGVCCALVNGDICGCQVELVEFTEDGLDLVLMGEIFYE